MFKYIRNYFLCLRFPFLRMKSYTGGKTLPLSSTWNDYLEKGWQKAFGMKLWKELKKAIKKDKCKDFRILDIKEKYGTLRISVSGASNSIYDILDAYEQNSKLVCYFCGKQAEFVTNGYILYVCNKCRKKRGLN